MRTIESIINDKYNDADVIKAFVNLYGNVSGLSKVSKVVLEFILNTFDKGDWINNNKVFRSDFRKYSKVHYDHDKFSDAIISRNLGILSDNSVLIKDSKGLYQINPEFYNIYLKKKITFSFGRIIEVDVT